MCNKSSISGVNWKGEGDMNCGRLSIYLSAYFWYLFRAGSALLYTIGLDETSQPVLFTHSLTVFTT
jgi:hypothetical protein